MDANKIRRLYDEESEADIDEAGATMRAVLTDPEMARNNVLVIAALAPTDPAFAALFDRFLQAMHLRADEIPARLADDVFALACGKQLLVEMEVMKPGSMLEPLLTPPPPRVERGKPKKKE